MELDGQNQLDDRLLVSDNGLVSLVLLACLARNGFFWINYSIKTGDFQGLKPQSSCRPLLGAIGRKLMVGLIPFTIL